MAKKTCEYCKKEFIGRSDKRFCSQTCKNQFNYQLRKQTKDITKEINNILHRNRIILNTIMGEKRGKMKVDRIELEKMNFNFKYITGYYVNKENKLYHYVYDFAWMEFSTQELLIVKNLRNRK